ncbi:MAG: hypothetical protein AB7Q42_08415 [Acidimicrobiia bacterium]
MLSRRTDLEAMVVELVGGRAPHEVLDDQPLAAVPFDSSAVPVGVCELTGETLQAFIGGSDEFLRNGARLLDARTAEHGALHALILKRSPTDVERDGTWAIVSPEIYLLLVDELGWSAGEYERWLSDTPWRESSREPEERRT